MSASTKCKAWPSLTPSGKSIPSNDLYGGFCLNLVAFHDLDFNPLGWYFASHCCFLFKTMFGELSWRKANTQRWGYSPASAEPVLWDTSLLSQSWVSQRTKGAAGPEAGPNVDEAVTLVMVLPCDDADIPVFLRCSFFVVVRNESLGEPEFDQR